MSKFKVTAGEENIKGSQILSAIGTSMPPRYVTTVDTKVEVEVEDGYCLCFAITNEFSERGALITNTPGRVKDGRVLLHVLNGGKQIVPITTGEPLADFWIEKVVE